MAGAALAGIDSVGVVASVGAASGMMAGGAAGTGVGVCVDSGSGVCSGSGCWLGCRCRRRCLLGLGCWLGRGCRRSCARWLGRWCRRRRRCWCLGRRLCRCLRRCWRRRSCRCRCRRSRRCRCGRRCRRRRGYRWRCSLVHHLVSCFGGGLRTRCCGWLCCRGGARGLQPWRRHRRASHEERSNGDESSGVMHKG